MIKFGFVLIYQRGVEVNLKSSVFSLANPKMNLTFLEIVDVLLSYVHMFKHRTTSNESMFKFPDHMVGQLKGNAFILSIYVPVYSRGTTSLQSIRSTREKLIRYLGHGRVVSTSFSAIGVIE